LFAFFCCDIISDEIAGANDEIAARISDVKIIMELKSDMPRHAYTCELQKVENLKNAEM